MKNQTKSETVEEQKEQLFNEYRDILMQFAKSEFTVSAATFADGDWFIQIRDGGVEYAIARDRDNDAIDARVAAEDMPYSIYCDSVDTAKNHLLAQLNWSR